MILCMDIGAWLTRLRENTADHGIRGVRKSMSEVKNFSIRKILSITYPTGESIYNRDWDVLIVLDACRVDLMQAAADDYHFIEGIDEFISKGSTSVEWMEKNFNTHNNKSMGETIYICGNPFSAEQLDESDFLELIEIWKDSWDSDLGTVRPRPITDRAIQYHRSNNPPRMIIHYMQPHHPFISGDVGEALDLTQFGEENTSTTPWTLLEKGEVSREKVWKEYLENLELVLTDIELLLENMSAEKVVITSDHGNAMGEKGIYGHPYGWPLNSLKKVPWVVTSAEDSKEYQPDIQEKQIDTTVEERLKTLGYQ